MKNKNKRFPKGFFTVDGLPTENTYNMFRVYFRNTPYEEWYSPKINERGLRKVRKFFKMDYGFDVMIVWGLCPQCMASTTSNGRARAMAYAANIIRAELLMSADF